ncbi:MAG: sulfatase-like hydrolase/transferase [Candidatus Sumerlaeota bacterium]|nr:sulfatase-like hydrolase/transferase [Candidatus Sumerlaeota bacterium]
MNSILIVLDTWRRDHSGAYGNQRIHTPNINKFATKSAVFENAYFASYPTLPCRRDILTGRYEFPWRGWGGLEPTDMTLPAILKRAGKLSYFITDVYHHWGRDAGSYWRDFTGFDLVRGQEKDGYIPDTDIQFEYRTLDYPPHNRADEPHFRNAQYLRKEEKDWFSPQVLSRAARWVQHNAAHQDFFLMVDSFDPHEPWDPPRHYINLYEDPGYKGREFPVAPYGPVEKHLTPAELKHVQAQYAGEVTMVDRWVGYLLDEIEAIGLMQNTMIILTTDHGTFNGDHGRTGKNWVLWEPLSHIPLIIWHPQFGHGARLKQFIQPIDYSPTILEAAGLPPVEGLHGKSFLPLLKDPGQKDSRDAILFGAFTFACNITDGEWALHQGVDSSNPPLYSYSQIISKWGSDDWGPYEGVRRLVGPKNANTADSERGQTHLYHLAEDPKEEKDLSAAAPDQMRRLQKLIIQKLEAINAPRELMRRWGLDRI